MSYWKCKTCGFKTAWEPAAKLHQQRHPMRKVPSIFGPQP